MDFFRGRYTPRKLGVLLDGLPRHSHYEQAKSEDMDLAEVMETAPKVKAKPPLAEFSREQELLIAVYHRLGGIQSLLARKKIRDKPWPMPDSAADQLKRRRAREASEHVESMLRYPDGRKLV